MSGKRHQNERGFFLQLHRMEKNSIVLLPGFGDDWKLVDVERMSRRRVRVALNPLKFGDSRTSC